MPTVAYYAAGYALATWLLPPLFTLLHELGHALAIVVLTREHTVVTVGKEPTRAVTFGRLTIRFRFSTWRWAWFGYAGADIEPPPSRARRLAILAAGPLATAAVLALFIVAALSVGGRASLVLWIPVVALAWQFFVTALPMRYPRWFGPYAGRTSDGYRVVRLLRGDQS